jgi:two-component system CheB/CheR fusion protein
VSGIGVVTALRALPVLGGCMYIALTGYTGDEIARQIASAGFDVHMTKPVNVEQLLGLVNGARDRRLSGTDSGST